MSDKDKSTTPSPEYWGDEMSESERAELQSGLSERSGGGEEQRELNALWRELAELPDEKPSQALQARFDAMLEAYAAGQTSAGWTARIAARAGAVLSRWWPQRPAWQLGLAFATLILGVILGRFWFGTAASDSELASLRSEMQSMRQLVTLSLLQRHSSAERLRGVVLSQQLPQPGDEVYAALLLVLNGDPNVNVRLAAVDALQHFQQTPQIQQDLARALVQQNSPLVQIALINLLVEIQDQQSLNVLQQLAGDRGLNPVVRQRAQWGIEQLY